MDPKSRAVGNMSASRISSGTGDWVNLELFAENGYLKYSSLNPDHYEYFLESDQKCIKQAVGSNYKPITGFPSGHVPAGWLRAMIHAHYIFLTGDLRVSFLPDLAHGLAVQRIVRETASHLSLSSEMQELQVQTWKAAISAPEASLICQNCLHSKCLACNRTTSPSH